MLTNGGDDRHLGNAAAYIFISGPRDNLRC